MGDLVAEGALSVSDGYRVRNEELGADGIPFVRGGDIGDGWINTATTDHIRPELADRVRAKLARPGDVAFIAKGTVGRSGRLRVGQPAVVFAPQVAYWRVLAPEVVDPRFLFYLTRSWEFQSALDGVKTHGSMAADYVSISQQLDFAFRFPDIRTQRAIAHILGALDDKIELNRRMNETLEAIARALFKSWFVDFDPVRAKAGGRDQSLPEPLAHLFPGSLEASTFGHISKGWEMCAIHSVATIIYGAPFRSALFNDTGLGTPLIRIRDLATHEPEVFTTEKHPRGYLVEAGDLIVGMDGEFRAHRWRGPQAWLNQRLCCLRPHSGFPRTWLHYSIERLLNFFERSKTGTTVIHLGKRDVDTFRVLVPGRSLVEAFGMIAAPLDARIRLLSQQSRTLAALRDALLPKLISGELRLTDAERIAGRMGA